MEEERAIGLLSLPPELHALIISHLDLGTEYLYRTQVCQHLRTLFRRRVAGCFKPLCNGHRLSLVEWREAAQLVRTILERQARLQQRPSSTSRSPSPFPPDTLAPSPAAAAAQSKHQKTSSIWSTRLQPTPAPAPAHPRASIVVGPHGARRVLRVPATLDDADSVSASDVNFLRRCLTLLGYESENDGDDDDDHGRPLRVLCLVARTGFGTEALTNLLRIRSCLSSISTVIQTTGGRYDEEEWDSFHPSAAMASRERSPEETPPAEASNVVTQAIVVPRQSAQKGYGLRSGFRCRCFRPSCSSSPIFHVIFHDWYSTEEALSTEEMLAHSDITCNACKSDILF